MRQVRLHRGPTHEEILKQAGPFDVMAEQCGATADAFERRQLIELPTTLASERLGVVVEQRGDDPGGELGEGNWVEPLSIPAGIASISAERCGCFVTITLKEGKVVPQVDHDAALCGSVSIGIARSASDALQVLSVEGQRPNPNARPYRSDLLGEKQLEKLCRSRTSQCAMFCVLTAHTKFATPHFDRREERLLTREHLGDGGCVGIGDRSVPRLAG